MLSVLHDLVKSTKTLSDIFVAREEYAGRKDEYGRFLHRFSERRDALDPVVSRYLVTNGLLNPSWPDDHKFAACLTHDIDFIYPTWRETLEATRRHLVRSDPKGAVRALLAKMSRDASRSPYCTFDAITKIEAAYEAKSSFYFKATATATLMDRFYDPMDLTVNFGRIVDAGSEIGLHLGYYSYDNADEMRKEKQRLEKVLNRKIVGVRVHDLRFAVPTTWRLLADVGFKYDTTFGYDDMPGFRNGMAHPFKPYDLTTQAEIDILEIPLVVMDKTLEDLGLSNPWNIVNRLVEVTERNKGVITILWHNDRFEKDSRAPWIRLYERILSTLKERNAWMTSAEEICNYWLRNAP